MKAIRDGLLNAGHYVHTFTLSTVKFPVKAEIAANIPDFSYAFLDTSVRIMPALRDLILNRSYNISRFHHPSIVEKIKSLLLEKKWDIVLVESQFMMPYIDTIRSLFQGPVIMRTLNVEYVIWERVASNERNFLKRWYLNILAKQLKKYEIGCFALADAVATISDVDTEQTRLMQPQADVETIAFAIPKRCDEPRKKKFTARFGHIGSMDWAPNAEGIAWFLSEVWPEIRKQTSEASLHLAGRNMPDNLISNEAMGVFVHGEVDSAEEFMQSLDALIVPLLSGSGVRIKIAEAMSLGIPVVTTPVGAEGLMVENGTDIIICDGAAAMISIIPRIVADPSLIENIGKESIKTIRNQHSPEIITQKLEALIQRKMKS
jgi:glycosyltransferase involved in cell wall biosynthesis